MTKAKEDKAAPTDNMEQSKKDGTVTTEEGEVVDAGTGVAAAPDPAAEKARELSWDEVEALRGDLEPGDEGWIELSDKGEPIGVAKKGKAPIGVLSASVICPIDSRPHGLATPSGANLSARMNPDANRSEQRNTLQGDESEKAE